MGKGHRDNHVARGKRGAVAIAKKAERRAPPKKPKCSVCGNETRAKMLWLGICPGCLGRAAKQRDKEILG